MVRAKSPRDPHLERLARATPTQRLRFDLAQKRIRNVLRQHVIANHRTLELLMAVGIRAFLAVEAFPSFSGTVFALGPLLNLFLARQSLDSKRFAFGGAFHEGTVVFRLVPSSHRQPRFPTTTFARIPAAVNTGTEDIRRRSI